MSGCWVTWPADIRSRPDIDDIRRHLDHATAVLCQHRDVIDAAYEHDPYAATVQFVLRVRFGISETVATDQAFAALQRALPVAGFATKHAGPATPGPAAWLYFTRWPSHFRWR